MEVFAKKFRESLGLTQGQMATESGLGYSTIQNIEGRKRVGKETIQKYKEFVAKRGGPEALRELEEILSKTAEEKIGADDAHLVAVFREFLKWRRTRRHLPAIGPRALPAAVSSIDEEAEEGEDLLVVKPKKQEKGHR